VLILLVVTKKMYQSRFEDFIALMASAKFMVIKSKEHKALFGFNILMFIIHCLSISILLFIIYRTFYSLEVEDTAVVFLRIITAYSFFILLKITAEKMIANIFDIDDIMDNYLFQKHTYRNFISMLLLPISIFLVYTPNPNIWIFYIITGFLILAGIFTIYQVIIKNETVITRNWFYFILYICALEITPYVILYKLITIDKGI
jgi:hypothetical protein